MTRGDFNEDDEALISIGVLRGVDEDKGTTVWNPVRVQISTRAQGKQAPWSNQERRWS
jgi:hypothetical protein